MKEFATFDSYMPDGEAVDLDRIRNEDVEYMNEVLSRWTVTCGHPVGTCAIGKVVDDDLKVIGTDNVYVCDGSVFRSMPSGNSNAPIISLAQRFTEVINSKHVVNDTDRILTAEERKLSFN